MPRNGSDGSYALADTVAPATLADANEVQTILNDLATALTDSIAKDGQTPLTGQLKGLVSANPVYSFNGDANTGLGSDTADEVFIKCGGTKIAKLSAAGLDVLSGALLVGGGRIIPTGVAFGYVGTTAPAGYVLGNGGSIGDALSGATERANADCLDLFTLEWNSANQSGGEGQVQDSAGSNVARGANAAADWAAHRRILVPDYQDRVERGKSASTAMGQTAGADSVSILQANLPDITQTTTIPAGQGLHGHPLLKGAPGSASASRAGNTDGSNQSQQSDNIVAATLPQMTGTTPSGGSGTALDIKPKSIVKTKIIKL